MAADVGGLVADIGLNVAGLREDIKRSNSELGRGTNRMNRHLGSMRKSVDSVSRGFRGLVGIIAGGIFVRHIKETLDAADKMLKLTQRLGGTTEAMSELEFVADRSGIAFNTLTMGLQRMVRRVAEAAEGTGEAKGALRELNIEAKALRELPLDVQFEIIADRLSKVTNEADRVRLAMKLFDSEGVALLQTMTNGAKGIQDLRQEAQRLGVTLRQDQAEAAARAKDAMTNLSAQWSSFTRNLTIDAIPTVAAVVEKLNELRSAAKTGTVALVDLLFPNFEKEKIDEAAEAFDAFRDAKKELLGLQDAANSRADLASSLQSTITAKQKEVNRLYEHWQSLTQKLAQGHRDLVESNAAAAEASANAITKALSATRSPPELLQELTIETKSDRILRPEAREDIEEFQRTVMFATDEVDRLNNIAGQLGLTFSSAFEDALISGQGLRGVLHGILQDIIRIAARLAVTQPLGNLLGGMFGSLFGGLGGATPVPAGGGGGRGFAGFADGGSFRVGGSGGTDSQLVSFRASPDEQVTVTKPGQSVGGNIRINYTIDARGADEASVINRMVPLMQQTVELTKSEIRRDMKEGRL